MAQLKTARVVSDGTPHGTKVYDAAGQEIHGIVSLTYQISTREEMAVLAVSFLCVSANITGELTE